MEALAGILLLTPEEININASFYKSVDLRKAADTASY